MKAAECDSECDNAVKKKTSSSSFSFLRRFASVSCLRRSLSPASVCEAAEAAAAASRVAATPSASPQPQHPAESAQLPRQENQHHLTTLVKTYQAVRTTIQLPPPQPPPPHLLGAIQGPVPENRDSIVARRPRTGAESEVQFIHSARAIDTTAAPSAPAHDQWDDLRPHRLSHVVTSGTSDKAALTPNRAEFPSRSVSASRGSCCRSGSRPEEMAPPVSVDSQSICEDETSLHAVAAHTLNVEHSEESVLTSSKAAGPGSGTIYVQKRPLSEKERKGLPNGDMEPEKQEIRTVAELGTPEAQAIAVETVVPQATDAAAAAEPSTSDQTNCDSCTHVDDAEKIAFANLGPPDNHHQMSTTTISSVSGVIECKRTQSFAATISTDIVDRGRANQAPVIKPSDIVECGQDNPHSVPKSTEIVKSGPANKPSSTTSTDVFECGPGYPAHSTISTEIFECVRAKKHRVPKPTEMVECGRANQPTVTAFTEIVERCRADPPHFHASSEVAEQVPSDPPPATTSTEIFECGRGVNLPAATASANIFECAEIIDGPNLTENVDVQDRDDKTGPGMMTTSPVEGFAPRVLETPMEGSPNLVGSAATSALNECDNEEQLSISRTGQYETTESETTEEVNQRNLCYERLSVDVETSEIDERSFVSSASLTLDSLTGGDGFAEDPPAMREMQAAVEHGEFRLDGDSERPSPTQLLQVQVHLSTSSSSSLMTSLMSLDLMPCTASDAQADVTMPTAESAEPVALSAAVATVETAGPPGPESVEAAEASYSEGHAKSAVERGMNAALEALHAAKSSEAAEEEAAPMDAIFGAGTTARDAIRRLFVLAVFRSFERLAPAADSRVQQADNRLDLTCFVKQGAQVHTAGGDLGDAASLCQGHRQQHIASQLHQSDDESCVVASGVRLEEQQLLWARPTTCGLKFAERIAVAPLVSQDGTEPPQPAASHGKQGNWQCR